MAVKVPKFPELLQQLRDGSVSDEMQRHYLDSLCAALMGNILFVITFAHVSIKANRMFSFWEIFAVVVIQILMFTFGLHTLYKINQGGDKCYFLQRFVCLLGYKCQKIVAFSTSFMLMATFALRVFYTENLPVDEQISISTWIFWLAVAAIALMWVYILMSAYRNMKKISQR